VPFATTTLQELKDDGITHVVLMPLYPQFSWTTTGSSLREWEQLRGPLGNTPWEETTVKNYYQDPDFIQAVNSRIDQAMERFPAADRQKVHFLFSAHGTPLGEVRSGDPYTFEVSRTVELVMQARGHDHSYWLGFQSRVGPAKWTEPNTEDLVRRLLSYGQKHLLVIPIAFVTDHIETLMELNIELREEMEDVEIQQLEVTQGLNDHPAFIRCLAKQALRAVNLPTLNNAAQHQPEEIPVPK
jgi:ferrochelatase